MTGDDSAIRPMGLYGATVFLLVLLFFVGLMAGSRWVSPTSLLSAIDGSSDLLTRITVLELRLPRNLLGILGGAALGVAGAVMQGVTRNSLASPGLTGVIASAALAVVSLRTLSSPGALWLPLMALAGGLLGGALTFAIAGRRQLQPRRLGIRLGLHSYCGRCDRRCGGDLRGKWRDGGRCVDCGAREPASVWPSWLRMG